MKEKLMSDFNFHWKQAKNLLTNRKYLSTDCRQALHLIVRLCEKGQNLEAENADLRNQLRDALERC
jgi:hypothetical protein